MKEIEEKFMKLPILADFWSKRHLNGKVIKADFQVFQFFFLQKSLLPSFLPKKLKMSLLQLSALKGD